VRTYSSEVVPRFQENLNLLQRAFELGEVDILEVFVARENFMRIPGRGTRRLSLVLRRGIHAGDDSSAARCSRSRPAEAKWEGADVFSDHAPQSARSRWLAVLVSVAIVAPPASALAQAPAIRAGARGGVRPVGDRGVRRGAGADAQPRLQRGGTLASIWRSSSSRSWVAPVELRAEAFRALAERYAPSEAYLSAQASDLERLVALEPGPAAAGRQQQAAVLRRQAKDAREVEQRRRKLVKPAM
jgi:hypothetical protein